MWNMIDLIEGKRRQSAVVNLAAAGVANAGNVMVVSTFAQGVGTKTLQIKRLKIRNNNCGNTWLHIGTGAAGTYVDAIPALYSVTNTTDDYQEFDLPQVQLGATITAYPEAVGAGSFDVQIECEEIG